ncbi:OmpA family protein [Thioalkalivibrio thiocyanodenitrificans]|uniref:OmpA family protein n=1 Tax=Thioalkalivibrio thiocyanodenitrificans TaxID=243063 RepID=UPI00035CAC32|nr:OmpA family protein [Thioalkalivibrio thiocyanodenitrificans]
MKQLLVLAIALAVTGCGLLATQPEDASGALPEPVYQPMEAGYGVVTERREHNNVIVMPSTNWMPGARANDFRQLGEYDLLPDSHLDAAIEPVAAPDAREASFEPGTVKEPEGSEDVHAAVAPEEAPGIGAETPEGGAELERAPQVETPRPAPRPVNLEGRDRDAIFEHPRYREMLEIVDPFDPKSEARDPVASSEPEIVDQDAMTPASGEPETDKPTGRPVSLDGRDRDAIFEHPQYQEMLDTVDPFDPKPEAQPVEITAEIEPATEEAPDAKAPAGPETDKPARPAVSLDGRDRDAIFAHPRYREMLEIVDPFDPKPHERKTVPSHEDEALEGDVVASIHFDTASARLTETAIETLRTLSPDARYALRGYADHRGDREMNRRLAQRRAYAVSQYLLGLGAQVSEVEGLGVVQDDVPADELWRDRRVDVHVEAPGEVKASVPGAARREALAHAKEAAELAHAQKPVDGQHAGLDREEPAARAALKKKVTESDVESRQGDAPDKPAGRPVSLDGRDRDAIFAHPRYREMLEIVDPFDPKPLARDPLASSEPEIVGQASAVEERVEPETDKPARRAVSLDGRDRDAIFKHPQYQEMLDTVDPFDPKPVAQPVEITAEIDPAPEEAPAAKALAEAETDKPAGRPVSLEGRDRDAIFAHPRYQEMLEIVDPFDPPPTGQDSFDATGEARIVRAKSERSAQAVKAPEEREVEPETVAAWVEAAHEDTEEDASSADQGQEYQPSPAGAAQLEAGRYHVAGETLVGIVYFPADSAQLTPTALLALEAIPGGERYTLHGFSDPRGGSQENLHLSLMRAQSVGQYLERLGREVVATHGQGDRYARSTPETFEFERRVEIHRYAREEEADEQSSERSATASEGGADVFILRPRPQALIGSPQFVP